MLLDCLNEKEKKSFKNKAYKKGEIIFNENEICHCLGVVISGEISISSYSFNGKEIVYKNLKENEMFGNNLLFSSDNTFKGNVIAKTACKLALISKENLINILQNNKAFLEAFLKIESDFTKELNDQIKLLGFDSIEEKLMFLFYKNSNKIVFSNVTRLAESLCVSREALSRLLSHLTKEKRIIRYKNLIKLIK